MLNIFALFLFLLMVLNYGAQMIRIPPSGFGVPVVEIFLVLFCVQLRFAQLTMRIRRAFAIHLYWAWFAYAITLVLIGLLNHGPVAIRDGSPVIESLYLFVGLYVARRYRNDQRKIESWCSWLGVVTIVYLALYPVKDALRTFLPVIVNSQGIGVPIFFNYISVPTVAFSIAAFWFCCYERDKKIAPLVGACALIVLTLIFLPSRTIILQIAFLFAFLAYFLKSKGKIELAVGSFIMATGVVLILGSGMVTTTRLGADIGADVYANLSKEIFDFGYEGEGLSSGNTGRLEWWGSIYENATSSLGALVFGVGYGVPLTDLVLPDGAEVREPHNDLVSVFGRSGVVGLSLFILLQTALISHHMKLIFRLKRLGRSAMPTIAFGFVFFMSVLIFSLGESPLIAPYFAVPYYLIAGYMIQFGLDWSQRNRVYAEIMNMKNSSQRVR